MENETRKDGRYVLYRAFAEGSRAKTFDAVDKREGRAVVVKKMDVRGAVSWKDVELAEREVAVLKSLRHKKLPSYYEHFEEDGALYLVMEKIDGESLSAMKRRNAQLGEDEIVRLLRDAEDVLRYLHSRVPAVIHRDLKPGNVIRKPDGTFAFVDFGAVRDRLKQDGGSTVVGTFGYMAPEQFQGRALPASDVYAIGATALTMLTGKEPEDLPHRGLAIDVRAAVKGLRVREPLVRALEKMLAPDPDERASEIPPVTLGGERARAAESHRAPSKQERKRDKRERKLARDVEGDARSKAERRAAEQERRARAKARRNEQRARRRERRAARRQNTPPIFWPIALLFSIGITIGVVAVAIAVKVTATLALRLLALFFAREPLRRAAAATSRAADRAIKRMQDAQEWMHSTPAQAEERLRVEAEEDLVRVAEERARIAVETQIEGDREEEEQAEREKKKRRA